MEPETALKAAEEACETYERTVEARTSEIRAQWTQWTELEKLKKQESEENQVKKSPGTPRKGKKGQPAPEPPHFDYDFQNVSESEIEKFAQEKAKEEAGPAPEAPDERVRAFRPLFGRNDAGKLLNISDPEILSLNYERFDVQKAASEASAAYRTSAELDEAAAELGRKRFEEQMAAMTNTKGGKGAKGAKNSKVTGTPKRTV